jgi:hypothetical protein
MRTRFRQWFRFRLRPGLRPGSRRKVRWRERRLRRIKTIGHIIGRIEPRIDGLNAEQFLAEFYEADV